MKKTGAFRKQRRIQIMLIGLVLSGLVSGPSVNAQEHMQELPAKKMPAQLTFLFPLGTNGLSSHSVINNFSMNMLAGISAGVHGAETGGLGNFTKGNVRGFQAAGLANATTGHVSGVQLAGLVNLNKGGVNGLQAVGLVNVVTGAVRGIQLAALVNAPTKSVKGVQAATLVNVNTGQLRGLQTGLTNVTTKGVTGAQIGLINYCRKLNGLQLGLINVGDTVENGMGMGLITYYKNGYHQFEVEWNESFFLNAAFKSGVEKFYMIYILRFKTDNNKAFWAPGIGFGSLFRLSQGLHLNADLTASQVNEDEWWTGALNLLNTLKLNFAFNFTDELAVFAGPSLNVVVSGVEDAEGLVVGDAFSPWDFYDETHSNNRVKMYLGLNAGIRF